MIMNKLVASTKRQGLIFSSPSPPRYIRLGSPCKTTNERRKGYVPVMVGEERFLIPAQFLAHPSIVALLEMSADEFGYGQEGILQIPCDPDCFRAILDTLPFKKR